MNLKTLAHIRLPDTICWEWSFVEPVALWRYDNVMRRNLYIFEGIQIRRILRIKPINVSSGYRFRANRTYVHKLSKNNFQFRYKRLKELAERITVENRVYSITLKGFR